LVEEVKETLKWVNLKLAEARIKNLGYKDMAILAGDPILALS
jgi:hypothetical protein